MFTRSYGEWWWGTRYTLCVPQTPTGIPVFVCDLLFDCKIAHHQNRRKKKKKKLFGLTFYCTADNLMQFLIAHQLHTCTKIPTHIHLITTNKLISSTSVCGYLDTHCYLHKHRTHTNTYTLWDYYNRLWFYVVHYFFFWFSFLFFFSIFFPKQFQFASLTASNPLHVWTLIWN